MYLLSYRIVLTERKKNKKERRRKRERKNGSMRPIISIDIGQVGNKNDSGIVYMYC